MNHQKLVNAMVIVLGTLILCALMFFAIPRGLYFLPVIMALLPLGILFTNEPRLLLMLMIATFFSGLKVPYVFASLNIFHLLAFAFIAIAFLDAFVRKERNLPPWSISTMLLLFVVNILWLMWLRGSGFRFLGDSNWGGMRYVLLLLGCGIYFNSTFITLSVRQWKTVMFFCFLLGTLPFIAESLFILSGGRVTFQYAFFEFASSTIYNLGVTLFGNEGVGRLQTAHYAGEMLLLLGLGFVFQEGRKRLIPTLLLFGLGVGIIALSGHRLGIIRAVAIFWVYFAVQNIRQIGHYIFISAMAMGAGILLIYILAPLLPLPAQRMVSFLPGIQIDAIAEVSAHSTTQWRLNLWRYAITEIPDFWILGKGFTFPEGIREGLALGGQQEYLQFWAIETVAYHNGILSLLIGMGLTGLLVGTTFLILVLVRYSRGMFSDWCDLRLRNIYATVYSLFVVNVGIYFTVYGDVQQSFPTFFFLAFLLEGMSNQNRKTLRVLRTDREAAVITANGLNN